VRIPQVRTRAASIALTVSTVAAATAALLVAPFTTAASNADTLAPTVTSAYCGHDTWAVSVTPAAGFDPLTATAAQLNANGFPERPRASDRHEYAQWRSFATRHAAEKTSCSGVTSEPAAHAGPSRPARPSRSAGPARLASTSTVQHAYWSGYGASGTYSDIEAEWDIPTVAATSLSHVASATWVGIGTGFARNTPLLQAGTWSDPGQAPLLFYEVVPEQGIQKLTNYHPAAKDLVGVHITEYQGFKPAGCTALACGSFHIWDTTQNVNNTYVVGGSWGNSSTANWIYERPCVDNSAGQCEIQALADAAPSFTEAQAVTGGSWHPLGALSGLGENVSIYTMYDCANQQWTFPELAHPWSIGGGGSDFTFEWLAYGTAQACHAPL
jgi:hypothetical protein